MQDSPLISQLRDRRAARGLSQAELAELAGISRQAVIQIEAGRQVPSTAIALALGRALGCTVEDLFSLPRAGTLRARVAGQGASRVALGRVDGEWVAHPVDAASPADGVVVDAEFVEPFESPGLIESNVLVAGCAPLLGALAGRVDRTGPDTRATWVSANSARSLELLAAGLVHVAGIHLATPTNEATVARAFPAQRTAVVNLTRWVQGLAVAPGNPLAIGGVADLLRPDVRVAARDQGSGAQRTLEALAGPHAPPPDWLARAPIGHSHEDVARLVRWGVVDVGVTIEAAALAQGLHFIPLVEERFDLVVPLARLGIPSVAAFIDRVGSRTFRADASRVAGYDMSLAGEARTVEGE